MRATFVPSCRTDSEMSDAVRRVGGCVIGDVVQ